MTGEWIDPSSVLWTTADHDGEATLVMEDKEKTERKGLGLRKVKKNDRLLGRIELQKQYYADDKIMYNKNTLWHDKDTTLIEKGAPWATPMEIARYSYPDKSGGKRDDVPVKKHDHGVDSQGYFLDEENKYEKPYEPLVGVISTPKRGLFDW